MNENTITSTDQNQIETVQVQISGGYFVTIDKDDYERVTQYKWTALPNKWTVYARRNIRRNGKQHSLYLHRFLMEPEEGVEVDHRDGNGLNCTRSNMRLSTKSQNAHNQKKRRTNTSGTKGVGFYRPTGKWQAYIGVHGIQKHLGFYNTKEEAIAIRHAAARLLHKDFHKLE